MESSSTTPRLDASVSRSPELITESTSQIGPDSLHAPPKSENSHLSFPTFDEPIQSTLSAPAEGPRSLLTDKLYVGNLHPSVDEYVL